MLCQEPKINKGFTLIELLIVVAIIAILALIAVPNYLEAQTRSKTARTRADMRAIASAIETYYVDNNDYPIGYNLAPRFGLDLLTSPVAYITHSRILDPFKPPGQPPQKSSLTYELMNVNGKIIEAGSGPYSVNPFNAGEEPAKGCWWWLASRGPNQTFGFRAGEPEFDLRKRFFNAGTKPDDFFATVYDPSNGTISNGNIYRCGGHITSPAGMFIQKIQ